MTLRPLSARWFQLVTTRAELAAVLDLLARTGAVELESFSRESKALFSSRLGEHLAHYEELARRYRVYWPPAAAASPSAVDEAERIAQEGLGRLQGWQEQADPVISSLEQLAQRRGGLDDLHHLLVASPEPLPDLSLLGEGGQNVSARIYRLPRQAVLETLPELLITKRIALNDCDYLIVVGGARDIAGLEDQLYALDARRVPVPSDLPGSADEAAGAISARLAELDGERSVLERRLERLSGEFELVDVIARFELIAWLHRNAEKLSAGDRLAWVTGWTTARDGADLCEVLAKADLHCVVSIEDPPRGAHPPTVLRNPGWARGFERLTRLLGSPGHNEADPSVVVALFAPVLFGFMFGDVGHGIVLLALGLALRKRFPVVGLLIPGGIMAIVFGCLYGEVLAREDIIPALWLRPLEHPIRILAVAVGLGVIVLAFGLVLNALQSHWRATGHAWWTRDFGLLAGYLALGAGIVWHPRLLWLALGGALWFVLGGTITGSQAGLAAIVKRLGEFTEAGLQLVVNTVSFARVGAFALAHAGLSLAVIEMAEIAGGPGYWIVFIFGNAVIVALEGLIVGIQTTRLLLFEFFARFLKGEGRTFDPLRPPDKDGETMNWERV